MSFPNKEERQKCWDSRDIYWKCLDENKSTETCKEFRKKYEEFCPGQWVKHFDKKRDYLVFKQRLEKEGISNKSEDAITPSCTDVTQRRRSFHTFPSSRPNTAHIFHKLQGMEPVHLPIRAKDRSTYVFKKDITENNIFTKDVTSIESLRKLIVQSSSKSNQLNKNDSEKWQPILRDVLCFICVNQEISCERVLLASHAYLSLRRALYNSEDFEKHVESLITLKTNQILDAKEVYLVYDIELFKLIICNGLLQMGNNLGFSLDIYRNIFKVVYPQCIRYTRYSYFSFKILQLWMQRTAKTNLWTSGSTKLEEQVEAVLFSNWDNTICKSNVLGLFAAYLQVMRRKYEDFLLYLFYRCVERLSWCHVTKYTILAELCDALDDANLLTEPKFLSSLFNSLTINHLCNASTKVYTCVCRKLSEEAWKSAFGEHLKNYVTTWESEKKYNALQALCKCWIEPVVRPYRGILPFLLDCCDDDCVIFRSHLLRISRKNGIAFSLLSNEEQLLLDNENEFVRLNAFAALCYAVTDNSTNDEIEKVTESVRHFLYFNANSGSTYLREGVFGHYRIFLSGLLKRASADSGAHAVDFLQWLHGFSIDCFEIGTSYQRKVFGLHIYRITLQFLFGNYGNDAVMTKDPRFKEAMRYGPTLRKQMMQDNQWKFTDKTIVTLLLRLVLDSASDVKEIASCLVIDFFYDNVITDSEKMNLCTIALSKCNSCKFFETDSGAYLFKILTIWFPLNEKNKTILTQDPNFTSACSILQFQDYSRFFFYEASKQLVLVKKDILKAIMQNTPFYGAVTALFSIGFNNGPESHLITKDFLEEIITLIEDAANYFLTALSFKSSNLEFSSSFEDMGLAIEEAIKNSEVNYEFDELVLSPAQQSILTCIWRSLKILCELAVEVAINQKASDMIIRRVSDLIFSISFKCRHKGVIESAGVAIYNLSRFLCKNEIHVEFLEGYLNKLLLDDYTTNINLTRRGAGLTIMFHKIVAGDVRADRPLLHLAVNSLIGSLSCSTIMGRDPMRFSNHDDPRAMQLHFLKSLVADKQFQAQLSPYLEHIGLTCFEYMPSQNFTIRNASFQLFGALVSRLAGQNTGARNLDFGYGYSINYFATHFPQLAANVLLTLQACCQPTENDGIQWQHTTSIIHALSLLSRLFFSGCDIVDGSSLTYIKQVRNFLNLFLSSPVAQIRHSAAKCLVAMVSLSSIDSEIENLKSQILSTGNFNRLHGLLCALELLLEKHNEETRSTTVRHSKRKSLSEVRKNLELRAKTEALWKFWVRRSTFVKQKRLCYAVESQLLRLTRHHGLAIVENYTVDSKKKNSLEIVLEGTRPGFFEFVDELMSLFANYVALNEDLAMVRTILDAKCPDFGVCFLKHAPRNNRPLLMCSVEHAVENFDKSHRLLLDEVNSYANESIRSIFRGRLVELQYADISKLKSLVTKLTDAMVWTPHLVELLTLVQVLSLRGSGAYDLLEDVVSCASQERVTLTNFFRHPEPLRRITARGVKALLCHFEHLSERCRATPLLTALVLARDELDLIRESILNSLLENVLIGCGLAETKLTDEIALRMLLLNLVSENSLLGQLNTADAFQLYGKYLATIDVGASTCDMENPFDLNDVASYKDETKLVNFVVFCMEQKMSQGPFTIGKGDFRNISNGVFATSRRLRLLMGIEESDVREILTIKNEEYLTRKLRVVCEVYLNGSL